jgi:hypothetical protein
VAPEWLAAIVEQEGVPVALRVRPDIDTAKHKSTYPLLVRVTHKLAQVQENGLPEPGYNKTLFDLDLAISAAVAGDGTGVIVLIVTSGGRRHYYGYVAPSARAAAQLRSIRKRFPGNELSLTTKEDPEWNLYSEYHERFGW